MAEIKTSHQLDRDLVKAYLSTPESCFGDNEHRFSREGNPEDPFLTKTGIRRFIDANREVVVSVYESNKGAECLDIQFAIRNGDKVSIFQFNAATSITKDEAVAKLETVLDRIIRIDNAFKGAIELGDFKGQLGLAIKADLGVPRDIPIRCSDHTLRQ